MTEHKFSEGELRELQILCGIPHLPTQLTAECRFAISNEGPRAYDWTDKPHRLVYDLCREVERLTAERDEARDSESRLRYPDTTGQ